MKRLSLTIPGLIMLTAILLSACQPAADNKSANDQSGASAATTSGSSLKVLAVETFLQDITQEIAGERLTVTSLIPIGLDPHAFEPAPRDVAKIAESDLVITNGAGFESWLEETLTNTGGQVQLVEAAAGLESRLAREGEEAVITPEEQATEICNGLSGLTPTAEVQAGTDVSMAVELHSGQPAGEDDHEIEWVNIHLAKNSGYVKLEVVEAGDTLIASGAGQIKVLNQAGNIQEVEETLPLTCAGLAQGLVIELEPGEYTLSLNNFETEITPLAAGPLGDLTGQHHHHEGDPHFWLDPNQVIHYVENIQAGLSAADPQGAALYAQNASAYIEELKALDSWINQQVAAIPPERRLIVTNHESFGYFADRYGFTIIGTIVPSVTTDSAPSAQQLARLVDHIRSTGAIAIFLETGSNPKLAEQIAAETGVKVITDLYTHSITAPDGPAPTYIDMMKYNVTQVVAALK